MRIKLPLLWLLVVALPMISSSVIADNDGAEATDRRELTLLNWSDYLDPELITRFEKQFRAEVAEVYFETDLDRDGILVEADGKGYDLALVDGVSIGTYRRRDWVAPLDKARLPNLDHIDPRWNDAFGAQDYAVPYLWGTMGIAYRTDLVAAPITRWQQLLQPSEALRGKIVMINDQRDMPAAALAALGYSVNSTNATELAEAEALLLAQKPYVKDYGYVSLTEKSGLVSGEVIAAMVYSGDALALQEHHEAISYVLPEEGSILWVDYLVVMRSSPNKELALAFINFLNEPSNAAQLAEFAYYATPNRGAEKLLPEEFLADTVIYPPQAQLQRSVLLAKLGPRPMKRYAGVFANVVR